MATKKSKKYYTVRLPVKPYIKKFVTSVYGDNIRIDTYSTIGVLCMLALKKNIYHSRFVKGHHDSVVYEEQISLKVNSWQYAHLGFDLSETHIFCINKFLESNFLEALYIYCHHATNTEGRYKGYKEAILEFCNKHSIEVEYDIKYDTLKKREMRYRQSQRPYLTE